MRLILKSLLFLFPITTFGQKVTVTADNMNVLYKGCNNPLTVVVENHDCSEVIAKSDNGTLSGSDCVYNYFNTDSTSKSTRVFVGIKKDSLIKWVDTLSFRLKEIPPPTVFIAGCKGGTISKYVFIAAAQLYLDYGVDGNLDYYHIKDFAIKILRKDSIIFSSNYISGSKISTPILSFINMNCHSGDVVIMYNIAALGPDKTKSYLNDIELTFN